MIVLARDLGLDEDARVRKHLHFRVVRAQRVDHHVFLEDARLDDALEARAAVSSAGGYSLMSLSMFSVIFLASTSLCSSEALERYICGDSDFLSQLSGRIFSKSDFLAITRDAASHSFVTDLAFSCLVSFLMFKMASFEYDAPWVPRHAHRGTGCRCSRCPEECSGFLAHFG